MPISEEMRKKLRKPFGDVLDGGDAIARMGKARPALVVAVGDDTVYRLLQKGVAPDIGVYDLMCKRMPIGQEMRKAILDASEGALVAKNPPGGITGELEGAVEGALAKGRGWIRVDGEDDLAALLFMAKAPDGAVILYGQPNEGMVWVKIDENIRKKALEMRNRIRLET